MPKALLLFLIAVTVLLPGGVVLAQESGAPTHTLVPERNHLRAVLRKAGALAVLAHDHVLVVPRPEAHIVHEPGSPATTRVRVSFPVTALRVDQPADREAAGLDGTLSEGARADVRESMLGPEQLDAQRHPHITGTLERLRGPAGGREAVLRLRIKGNEHRLTVPVTLRTVGDTIVAEGRFTLRQSAFGIEPYRILAGAIAVRDEVSVDFRLVARKVDP